MKVPIRHALNGFDIVNRIISILLSAQSKVQQRQLRIDTMEPFAYSFIERYVHESCAQADLTSREFPMSCFSALSKLVQ